ncbi:cytochrome b [Gymnodinialimonas sp. 2305UL16-5]|uniref:cytochrome b n=1 Tax=Gymnodinialimonas mytili TaxID=3126503 RepID=UPI0030B1F1DF
MSRPLTYGPISRVNHWLIAIVMIGMLCFGLYLGYSDLPREERGPLIGIHRSLGVLVLIVGLWRVGWRLVEGFPIEAATLPIWQARLSRWIHWLLLAGVLLMPLSGIISSVFRGRPVEVFGWFTIPAQSEVDWLAALGGGIHSALGISLCIAVLVHVGAALKRHAIDRDVTLIRMLTGRARQG